MELANHSWPSTAQSTIKYLFLHGMGGTGALWRPVALGLENFASVIAPDQRGHGGSRDSTLTSYHPLDYATDVAALMRDQHFFKSIVVGHSMGARTASALAHLKPDWVSALVLVDLGLKGLAGGSLGPVLAQFLKELPPEFSSRDAARSYMTQNCPDESIGQYLMAVSMRREDGSITFPFDAEALQKTIIASQHVSLEPWIEEFARTGKPVLILRGERSRVYLKETFLEEREKLSHYPNILFEEWMGCGHGLPFEKRIEFVERLKALASTV